MQWEEIKKADAMLAGVRARHAGLVEQQLRHLILTQPLATDNVWQKVCQVCICLLVCVPGNLLLQGGLRSRTAQHVPAAVPHPAEIAWLGDLVLPRLLRSGAVALVGTAASQAAVAWCPDDEAPGACCHACTAAAARRPDCALVRVSVYV